MNTPLVFTREKVREVDRLAIEEYGIPGIVLMENAARGLAEFILRYIHQNFLERASILALCGSGNNAGDALAAARHLHNAGLAVTVFLTSAAEKLSPDAAVHLKTCRAMGLRIVDGSRDPASTLKQLERHDLILDGLLGTGLSSPVREPLLSVIRWVNTRQETHVIAIDIPSGLDCDTGEPLGAAVCADATVTFVGPKRGFAQSGAVQFTGEVHVVDIGAPRELVERLGERD